MTIAFSRSARQFHLRNARVSYVLRVLDDGELNHLYWGPALRDDGSFADLQEEVARDTLQESEDPRALSLEQIRREYPTE